MTALFEKIETEIAPLEAVVFNIGANVNFPIRETTARVYRKVWEMAAFAGFLAGRETAKVMVPRGKGTIIFTGCLGKGAAAGCAQAMAGRPAAEAARAAPCRNRRRCIVSPIILEQCFRKSKET